MVQEPPPFAPPIVPVIINFCNLYQHFYVVVGVMTIYFCMRFWGLSRRRGIMHSRGQLENIPIIFRRQSPSAIRRFLRAKSDNNNQKTDSQFCQDIYNRYSLLGLIFVHGRYLRANIYRWYALGWSPCSSNSWMGVWCIKKSNFLDCGELVEQGSFYFLVCFCLYDPWKGSFNPKEFFENLAYFLFPEFS